MSAARSRNGGLVDSALWPFVFYGAGSVCFLIGTIIAVVQIVGQKGS